MDGSLITIQLNVSGNGISFTVEKSPSKSINDMIVLIMQFVKSNFKHIPLIEDSINTKIEIYRVGEELRYRVFTEKTNNKLLLNISNIITELIANLLIVAFFSYEIGYKSGYRDNIVKKTVEQFIEDIMKKPS